MRMILKEKPTAKFRVWVGDGSGATYEESGLVEEGIIQLASWEGRDYPISTLYQAAEGFWPADVHDPKSPLVKPTPDSIKDITLWAFEGLSVGAAYIMGDQKGGLAYRAGQGEKIGQDAAFRIVDGDVDAKGAPKNADTRVYGGVPLAGYGVAQRRILGWMERAKALPGEFMIMTAHERQAEDKLTKEQIIGPEVAGNALTATIQRYFGNTLHFAIAEKRSKDKDDFNARMMDDLEVQHRLYTKSHISATTGQKYLAITRGGLTDTEMPPYLVSKEAGDAIEEYYTRLAKAREARRPKSTPTPEAA